MGGPGGVSTRINDMKDYLKPELPERFDLVWENGYVDGVFSRYDLSASTHLGKPYALMGEGFPVILRLLKQEGNLLYMEEQPGGRKHTVRIRLVGSHREPDASRASSR